MTTAVEPDEPVFSARFPKAKRGVGFGFAEIARRHGDFALAGIALRSEPTTALPKGASGLLRRLRRTVIRGVSDWLASAVGSASASTPEADIREALGGDAAEFADSAVKDTSGDSHGSAAYRRQLVAALASRELATRVLARNRKHPGREHCGYKH